MTAQIDLIYKMLGQYIREHHNAYLNKYDDYYKIWNEGYKMYLEGLIEFLQINELQSQIEEDSEGPTVLEPERDESYQDRRIDSTANDSLQDTFNRPSSDLQHRAEDTSPSNSGNIQKQSSKKKAQSGLIDKRESRKMTISELVRKAARMGLDKAVVKVLVEENIVQDRDEHDITEIGIKIVTAILEEIRKTPSMSYIDVSSSDSEEDDPVTHSSSKRKRLDS
jgi:hypothetical protein